MYQVNKKTDVKSLQKTNARKDFVVVLHISRLEFGNSPSLYS